MGTYSRFPENVATALIFKGSISKRLMPLGAVQIYRTEQTFF